jgi:hypothetical protein
MAEWIRGEGFDNPRKAPNHAFRHWWKSTAARIGMQDSLADAIQGHAGRSVASTYRHFDLETLEKGIAAIPVPAEKSDHQTDADLAIADHREPVGRGAMGRSRLRQT